MDPLYQEHILDHYKHPRHKGRLEDAEIVTRGRNASCGDDCTVYLKLIHEPTCVYATADRGFHTDPAETVPVRGQCCDARIAVGTFEGFGCAISQGGASLLFETIQGKSRAEIAVLSKDTMDTLLGTEVGPQREKCAMLALSTLQEAFGLGHGQV